MTKIKFSILFFLLAFQSVVAQDEPFYKSYSWEEEPTYNTEVETNFGTNILKHAIVTEFYYEGDNLVEYFLEHLVIKLDSDDAIESHNKVYIPFSSSAEVDISKARVITANKEIRVLDDSKILTSEDQETGQRYKYFAFEGIEKGSIIDYYYVVKKHPAYKGKRLTFQSTSPKKNVSFDFFSPKNLAFVFKSYNGLPEAKIDTLSDAKFHWKMIADNIEALEEETFSAYNASKGFIVYKLNKNLVNNNIGFASHSTTTKNLYAFYYPEYSKKVNELINKFISKIDITDKENFETIIREIESYIKTTVYISDTSDDALENLEQILTKDIASESGVIKLYISIFRTLGIKHELVFTSNRQDLKFDKDFEAINFLTDVLFYFPDFKTYLSPEEIDTRYGYPPAYLTDNYGLFVKEVNLSGFKSGVGKVRYIDAIKAENTFDNMIINVEFDKDDLTENVIGLNRSMSGYYAMYIQPFIHLANKEDKEDLIDSFAKNLDDNAEILEKKVVNDDPKLFGKKPFEVNISFKSDAFTEIAGEKIFLKIGELIGQQTQMYQEKKRILPIENEFNRAYLRTINVHIPEGYKVVNLEDINISNSYALNGQDIVSFKSFYELDNNILKIKADEHYRKNIMDVSLFEEFRKVINSAADFNKIILVLESIK
ncbi:DUF3857 domain-containing protein [uncultured Psychroserpens sp.]|uniref:DUF3857 domain-containing protein n=1 Tax=uncultured Psychroserpens sp. TaxID=255436 RepID=UPI002639C3DE|nr:DUF3857 domain-containing protein [uncultured Psychroserpens sp.]